MPCEILSFPMAMSQAPNYPKPWSHLLSHLLEPWFPSTVEQGVCVDTFFLLVCLLLIFPAWVNVRET